MATKRALKAASKDQKEISVKIEVSPTVSDATPFLYCNYVSVAQTRYDFVLTLAKLPALLTDRQREAVQKNRRLPVEAAFQIAIPTKLMPELINVLNEQKRKYEERFGPIEREDSDGRKKPNNIG